MESVHIAITRIVKPGMQAAFDNALCDFVRQSLHETGTTGVHLVSPFPGVDGHEFGILRSFKNEAARRAFYSSDLYARWQSQIAPMVVGDPIVRQLNGLEAFFRGAEKDPPRWKMAIVTWVGVCLAVKLWSFMPNLLSGLHPLVVMAIVNGFIVATLAWGLMPFLTRLSAGWLRR